MSLPILRTHSSLFPPTSYSAWCSLTTTPVSHGPASPTPRTLRAKRALQSTLSKPPTAPTESKAGTHVTNKSMCPYKAVCLSMSVTSACSQCCPVCPSSTLRQTINRIWFVCVCSSECVCMYLLYGSVLHNFVCFPFEQDRLFTQLK